jgi:hypothetical protein
VRAKEDYLKSEEEGYPNTEEPRWVPALSPLLQNPAHPGTFPWDLALVPLFELKTMEVFVL